MYKRVVVTGFGVVANTGFGNEVFYHSLSTGCVDVATTTRWEEDDVDATFLVLYEIVWRLL